MKFTFFLFIFLIGCSYPSVQNVCSIDVTQTNYSPPTSSSVAVDQKKFWFFFDKNANACKEAGERELLAYKKNGYDIFLSFEDCRSHCLPNERPEDIILKARQYFGCPPEHVMIAVYNAVYCRSRSTKSYYGPYAFWHSKTKKIAELGFYGHVGKIERLQKWYDNGQIFEDLTMFNGKKHGIFLSWHKNGQPFIEGAYRDDKPIGKWIVFNQDGFEMAHYDLGTWGTGEWSEWTDDQIKIRSGHFFQGKEKGWWVFRQDDGALSHIGYFLNGERHGFWIFFHSKRLFEAIQWYQFGQRKE